MKRVVVISGIALIGLLVGSCFYERFKPAKKYVFIFDLPVESPIVLHEDPKFGVKPVRRGSFYVYDLRTSRTIQSFKPFYTWHQNWWLPADDVAGLDDVEFEDLATSYPGVVRRKTANVIELAARWRNPSAVKAQEQP